MEKEFRRCQRCGHTYVAGVTAKCWNQFGLKWPGGQIHQGKVLPHTLIGLRENGASAGYVNFSYCMVCGQIQGDFPTQAGDKYLREYAEDRLWEVTVCTTNTHRADLECEATHGWYNLYFTAKTEDQVERHMSSAEGPDSFERYFINEIGLLPDGVDVEEL